MIAICHSPVTLFRMMITWKRAFIGLAPIIALSLALHGCGTDVQHTIPEGPQTLTGVLVPAPLSIVRRGSHIFRQNGEDVYYAESSMVDLRDYVNMDAVVEGVVERNTDTKDLPVLVISGATLVEMPMRAWEVSALGLSISVPESWEGHQFDDGAQFAETGSTITLLSIHSSALTQLPAGNMLQLPGVRAVRTSGTGAELVYIQRGRDIVVMEFKQQNDQVMTEGRVRQYIIKSIRFTSTPSSVGGSAARSSSGTQDGSTPAGAPCGGPAGVLCPTGQYCEVTDASTNIGRCRALQR